VTGLSLVHAVPFHRHVSLTVPVDDFPPKSRTDAGEVVPSGAIAGLERTGVTSDVL
jgi:hypothetical protein